MGWDFSIDPQLQDHLDWAERLVRTRVQPLEGLAEDLTLPELEAELNPLRDEVRTQGLWAAHLGTEDGGHGMGQVALGLLHEVLGMSVLAPYVFGANAPDSGNGELLAKFGSPEQKRRYLGPLLAGECWSAFSMTEPDTAGSDPTLLSTIAVRDGDDWVINGRKWFTTNGSIARFLIVMAVTDPTAGPHARASMFIVDADAPGVSIVRDIPTMEHPHLTRHGLGSHAEIDYRDVRVSADAMLGGLGEGFAVAQRRLGPGRIHHCMRWLGMSRRAFELLCDQANRRYAHGGLLAEKQTIQNWIADSAADMHAARLMTLHAAWRIDNEGDRAARKEIAMIKYFGAKVLLDVIDRSIQAHGARGYSGDSPLEGMYRIARAARIYDGPDEVHRQMVARLELRKAASRSVEPVTPLSAEVA